MGTTKQFTILHSNDMHGDFLSEARSGSDKLIGGLALLSGYVNKIRHEEKNVLYVISGDMLQGSLIDTEYQGISTIEIMNYLSPDAVSLGNHEFDYRSDGLAKMLDAAKASNDPLPMIVQSNINWEASQGEYTEMLHKSMENYGVKKYAIIQAGDLKAAVFGLMGKD